MTNANKFNLLIDVAKHMHSLADGLESVAYAFADSQEIFAQTNENKADSEQSIKSIATEKSLTLEDVRAVLAVKSQNGMTAEVKKLIKRYGGSKLSDVDPKHYADIIKEAEVMGNG